MRLQKNIKMMKSQEQKELQEILWCQNDRIFYSYAWVTLPDCLKGVKDEVKQA